MARDKINVPDARNRLMTVKEYMERKDKRTYDFRFVITPTGSYYVSNRNGEKLSQQELDALLPIPENLWARRNADGTKTWALVE